MTEEPKIYDSLGRDEIHAIGPYAAEWFRVDEVVPALQISVDILIEHFQLNSIDLPDHFLALRGGKVSKYILTLSYIDSEETRPFFNPHYEIGFFDGKQFRGLDGYAIY